MLVVRHKSNIDDRKVKCECDFYFNILILEQPWFQALISSTMALDKLSKRWFRLTNGYRNPISTLLISKWPLLEVSLSRHCFLKFLRCELPAFLFQNNDLLNLSDTKYIFLRLSVTEMVLWDILCFNEATGNTQTSKVFLPSILYISNYNL